MDYFGLTPAEILLPKSDFGKFAVIACDQYTSEPQYWEAVEREAGDGVSAYHMILPEIFLGDRTEERIGRINGTMSEYLRSDVFSVHRDAMIYVERTLKNGDVRRGIVGAIDLEQYDYAPNSRSAIRATEQTVIERIPPRVNIRKNAPLELPHVMLLCDDPKFTLIEPIARRKGELSSAYDFDLMCGAGHIRGYFLDDEAKRGVCAALSALEASSEDGLLFAVGDGNHSLAAAKECYRQNPCEGTRRALVEVVNIHDKSLNFEPIYRVVFGADKADLLDYLRSSAPCGEKTHDFTVVDACGEQRLSLGACHALPVGTLQTLLDRYIRTHSEVTVDYIHGEDSVRDICRRGAVGFLFDGMRKDELFSSIRQSGSLPRKTFSMGHADDKRFYLEARRIK